MYEFGNLGNRRPIKMRTPLGFKLWFAFVVLAWLGAMIGIVAIIWHFAAKFW